MSVKGHVDLWSYLDVFHTFEKVVGNELDHEKKC